MPIEVVVAEVSELLGVSSQAQNILSFLELGEGLKVVFEGCADFSFRSLEAVRKQEQMKAEQSYMDLIVSDQSIELSSKSFRLNVFYRLPGKLLPHRILKLAITRIKF